MGRVIHFEITAERPERAKAFYEEVLGWTISSWEGPAEYLLVGTGSDRDAPGIDGGIMRAGGAFTGTITTAAVDDLSEALARVGAHGGSVVQEARAVPGVGWMAYCRDTEGNLFGLMQQDPGAA